VAAFTVIETRVLSGTTEITPAEPQVAAATALPVTGTGLGLLGLALALVVTGGAVLVLRPRATGPPISCGAPAPQQLGLCRKTTLPKE
jgi:hypothetical protein